MLQPSDISRAREVIGAAPCHVILPAGCGKTHMVATLAAVAAIDGRRVLLLTHTHAGVDALRKRIRRLRVPSSTVGLSTIAAWTLRLVESYPATAECDTARQQTWPDVCAAARRVLRNHHIAAMLAASYDLVVVDEYQDCTRAQHEVVLALNDVRPVVAVGDPLQAIYTFGDEQLVDWHRMDPLREYVLPCLGWRWKGVNERLGDYLLEVRSSLTAGEAIDLRHPAVRWVDATPAASRREFWRMADVAGTVTVIARFDAQCERIAKTLLGRFDLMEDIEGVRLLKTAQLVDHGDDARAAGAILALAKSSMANLPTTLTAKVQQLQSGTFPGFRADTSAAPTLTSLKHFAEARDPLSLRDALDAIDALGGTVCRREAWHDFRRAVAAWEQGAASLEEGVRATRNRTRMLGRRATPRTVSRAVLVKGQEFDHCVVTSPEAMNTCELYVAMTRASTSLTVISPTPTLQPTGS